MDYIKLIIFLFTNFSIIIILVLNVMAKRETGSALLHKTKQMPRINSNLETTIGLIIVAVFLFVIFTVPVLRDVPYLLTQNYAEASGKIIRCNEKSIVATITNENQEKINIEILGDYDLTPDTTIVVEYLPHMDLRVGWYILNPETMIKERPGSDKTALIDNEAFLLSMGLGIPAISFFLFIIFINKIKKMPVKTKQIILYIIKAAGIVAFLSILRLSQL